jgi:hypothetical protein
MFDIVSPALAVALAVTVTDPITVDPADGLVTDTDGGDDAPRAGCTDTSATTSSTPRKGSWR